MKIIVFDPPYVSVENFDIWCYFTSGIYVKVTVSKS